MREHVNDLMPILLKILGVSFHSYVPRQCFTHEIVSWDSKSLCQCYSRDRII